MTGYSLSDLGKIQARWDLHFPPDLIALMLTRRPLLPGGFDWLTTPADKISEIMRWPYNGFLFDVEQNDIWWPSWGLRPQTPSARASRLEEVMAASPKLIPLASHRYLPETPLESGNPVFSVYQTDVIHYGANLEDWLLAEEHGWSASNASDATLTLKRIDFWSRAVEIQSSGKKLH